MAHGKALPFTTHALSFTFRAAAGGRIDRLVFWSESCSPSQSTMQSTYYVYTQDGTMFKSSRKQFDSSRMTLIKASVYTQKHTHMCIHQVSCTGVYGGARVAICCVPEGPQTALMCPCALGMRPLPSAGGE